MSKELDSKAHTDIVELIRIEMGEVSCGNHGNEERLAALILGRLGYATPGDDDES